jgi:sulfur-carrier protein
MSTVSTPVPTATAATAAPHPTRDVRVTVRFFAGAKAAAGTRARTLTVPAGTTLDELVAALAADHGDALARVLAASSFLLDGLAVHDRARPVPDGAALDVLPPFAGG